MASVHARRRRVLDQLATDDVLLGVVEAPPTGTAGECSVGEWRRVYGRFLPKESILIGVDEVRPVPNAPTTVAPTTVAPTEVASLAPASAHAKPYALIVLERMAPRQDIRVVELFDARPDVDGTSGATILPHDTLGWAAVTRFPNDSRLRTLPRALQQAGESTIVRYRPGRRCTFRTCRAGETWFGKVFPHDDGRRLHLEAQQLWDASRVGALGFSVAEPAGWDADALTLWQRAVAGVPVYARLAGSDGHRFAGRLGEAAGTVTTAPLAPSERFDAAVQCQRSWSYAREIGARVPTLARAAESLVRTLESVHASCPTRPRPIHGAPHMNQWLVDGDTLGLVDFDRLSLGDPELDVATFLGELDFEGGLARSVDEIAASFIAGYETTAGRLDMRLLAAYRAHKRLAKALRSARSLRVDGDERAARHLGKAMQALEPREHQRVHMVTS